MEITLSYELQKEKNLNGFYTEDEATLLYQLENQLVETVSHDQVMENLRKKLGLGENDEV